MTLKIFATSLSKIILTAFIFAFALSFFGHHVAHAYSYTPDPNTGAAAAGWCDTTSNIADCIPQDLVATIQNFETYNGVYQPNSNNPCPTTDFVASWISDANMPGVDISGSQQFVPGQAYNLQINTVVMVCGQQSSSSSTLTVGNGLPENGTPYTTSIYPYLDSVNYYFKSITASIPGTGITNFAPGTQIAFNTSTTRYSFGQPIPFTFTAPPGTSGIQTDNITATQIPLEIFYTPNGTSPPTQTWDCTVQPQPSPPLVPGEGDWPTRCGTQQPVYGLYISPDVSPTISETASCASGTPPGAVTGTATNNNGWTGNQTVTWTASNGASGSITTTGYYSISMAGYDQLIGYTVNVSVADLVVNVSGGSSPGTAPPGTNSVRYGPCYTPACGSDVLTVPGDANGNQDGPIPGQSFNTTATVNFNSVNGAIPYSSGTTTVGGTTTQTFTGLTNQSATTQTNNPFVATWTTSTAGVDSYGYTFSDVADGGPSLSCPPQTVYVGYHPFVSVNGGDVTAGSGGFNTSTGSCSSSATSSAGILGYNNGNLGSANGGGGTDIASYAPNIINGFASGNGNTPSPYDIFVNTAPNGLSFANNYPSQPAMNSPYDGTYGGGFGPLGTGACANDYYDQAKTDVGPSPGLLPNPYTINLNNLSGVNGCDAPVTDPTTNVTTTSCWVTAPSGQAVNITGGTGLTGKIQIYVQGDVLISGNITVNDGSGTPYSSVAAIPSLYVVSSSNIYIDAGVTTLDGVFIAQPSTPTSNTGDIFTCTNMYSMWSAANLFSKCGDDTNAGEQLTVNGAFIANQVRFERTYGSEDQGAGTTQTVQNVTIPAPAVGNSWKFNGSASMNGNTLQLTPVVQNQKGSAFYTTSSIPMNSSTTIKVSYTENMSGGNGADGTTLTLANSTSALGALGCGDGYGGINGVAVGLDGYENWPAGSNGNPGPGPKPDPSGDFLGIAQSGGGAFATSGNGSCQMPWKALDDLSTGRPIPVQDDPLNVSITITSTNITAKVTQVIGGLTSTLSAPINQSGSGSVYLGFTGSTGGNTDLHDVYNFSGSYQTTINTAVFDYPAEVFNYSPMQWLTQPSNSSGILPVNPNYDSITALAPVL